MSHRDSRWLMGKPLVTYLDSMKICAPDQSPAHTHRSLTSCCPPVGGIVSSLEPISVKPGSSLSQPEFLFSQSDNTLKCIPVCGLLSGSSLSPGVIRGRQVQEAPVVCSGSFHWGISSDSTSFVNTVNDITCM